MIGETISHYKILAELGRGGMGVVYKAEDTRLQRTVALKFLPAAMTRDPVARERFVHEARAASALDHPNICTIHEIDESEDGHTFIVMSHYEGGTLKEKIGSGPLGIEEGLDIVYQISEGLHEAHGKEIIHRDIKPANIVITTGGLAKIMDFGLAKLRGQTVITREGTTLGTVSYMSPEQARGDEVDHRTDIWSLGVVLYEMVTGQRPFKGEYDQAVIYSVLNEDPKKPSSIRKEITAELDEIILRALAKDPGKRYQSIREFREALLESGVEFRAAFSRGSGSIARAVKRPAVVIPVLLAACICVFIALRYMQRAGKLRWVRREVLPQIMELVERENYYEAYELAMQVRDIAADEPLFERLLEEMTGGMTILTSPPGADVSIKKYEDPEGAWTSIGRTPLGEIAIPRGFFRWRIEKDGFIPVEIARSSGIDSLSFDLDATGTLPPGMIKVPGGKGMAWVSGYGWFWTADLQEFLVDRYEVTNRQFKAFVDGGGYRRREFWKHGFVENGRVLSWEKAVDLFRDKTGRPGPATWELGSFPDGQGDYPVTGVSWFEAEAYAEFAGKKLPSIHHWVYISSIRESAHIIPLSNFGSGGPAPTGSHHGMGLYGVYDMAGNACEWCYNAYGDERYILGGCWSDPLYSFTFPDRRSPFDRSFCNGFRCVKLIGERELPDSIWHEDIYTQPARDYSKAEPVPDDIFEAYKNLYMYEKTPLEPRVELVDDEPEHWWIEKISFDAAYGSERMFAYLFLPRDVPPPYQTVVLFPGAYALVMRSSGNGKGLNSFSFVDFVIRSGRAALCPVYKSTYERGDGFSIYDPDMTPSDHRAHILMWYKDLSRSIDYLETRDDIDVEKIAYFGSSYGGWLAPLFVAQDSRYRTAVLRLCGLPTWEMNPAFDAINFLPRVTIPVLMINGRYDYIFPHETSQMPMFESLGTPPEHKRHVVFETAHSVGGHRNEMIREVLDWLDRYLGPVQR